METGQPTGVYQTGDIVSLSMAASNVGQGGESEQLIEEHIVRAEAAVVTSVQWTWDVCIFSIISKVMEYTIICDHWIFWSNIRGKNGWTLNRNWHSPGVYKINPAGSDKQNFHKRFLIKKIYVATVGQGVLLPAHLTDEWIFRECQSLPNLSYRTY